MNRDVREVKRRKPSVKIGLFGKQGSDLVIQGSANEFGATIQHPGGTAYGYRTQRQAEQGKVRFMSKGEGFMVMGETGPHTIKIPERSFLRSTVAEKRQKIRDLVGELFGDFIDARTSLDKSLKIIGLKVSDMVRAKIRQGPFKPNAPATIRKKKSSKPLIDTSRMRNSVTHELDR